MKGGGGWLSQRQLGGWRAVRLKKTNKNTQMRSWETLSHLFQSCREEGEGWGVRKGVGFSLPTRPIWRRFHYKNMILVWFFGGFFGVQFSFKQLSLPLRLFSSFINTRNQERRAGPADASKVTEQKPEGSLKRPERGSRVKGPAFV